MKAFTVGSLFTGIGGLDLGLERAGCQIAWQCEIDDYATQVLEKHWPDVARFRDVRDCGAHNLDPVDLLAGGFPCKDISSAGKRAGINGEHSGLWSEFARLIRELRPRFVLVENVSALLHRGIDRVLGDLAACGYDAEWQVLSAHAFGAPHLRERVFMVASPSDLGCDTWRPQFTRSCRAIQPGRSGPSSSPVPQVSNVPDADCHRQWIGPLQPQPQPPCSEAANVSDDGPQQPVENATGPRCEKQHETKRIFCRPDPSSWWEVEPDVGRVVDGLPHRVDRLRGLGNAVVPQIAEYIGRCILQTGEELELL